MTTYTITTDNPNLYGRLFQMTLDPANHAPGGSPAPAPVQAAPAPVAAPAPAPVPTPPPAAVTPPPPAAAPAPAPVPAAPPPAAQQHGAAPPGWTIQHVQSALQALGANAAKGGPAAVKAILTEFGVTKVTDIDPARWPEVYAKATA